MQSSLIRLRFHAPLFLVLLAASPVPQAAAAGAGLSWHDARELGIEGRAFNDTKEFFDRLPARAEKTVRGAVWGLSRDSAGMAVRFVTDAPAISARWVLKSARLEMVHMPATGVSGVDLYARDERGVWRWLNVGRPGKQTNEVTLVSGLPAGSREYLLYLPLYNGIKELGIGVPAGSKLTKAPDYPAAKAKPLVFYGTSITHGGCASRPGMCHPAILGRRMGRPVVNLGFSGNGRMETEVAEFIAEIDAAVFILDCLPNITAKDVTERTASVVKLLRAKHPQTPILLVEDRNYSDGWLIASKKQRNETSQAALQAEFRKLQSAGVKQLYYLAADTLLGDDNEGTVDTSHPNDLGFWRHADAFEKVLRTIPGI